MSISNQRLEKYQRQAELEKVTNTCFDLVVVGAGATGAGIALEAVRRGKKVLLLEQNDVASGTSSRSTKLIHGGVRYLEKAVQQLDKAQYDLVKEALAERSNLLEMAPHLTRKLPILLPLYRYWQLPYFYIGLFLYDLLAGKRSIGRSAIKLSKSTLAMVPSLASDKLCGSVLYYDGQFDDARFNLELVLTARTLGASVYTRAEVQRFLYESGSISGLMVKDRLTGEQFTVQAKRVINATGPFVDKLRQADDSEAKSLVVPSSGIHIVVKGDLTPAGAGILIPKTSDGRVLFMLPWRGHTLIGTTDEEAKVEERPVATEREIGFVLEEVNKILEQPLSRDDVMSSWSGLRPLVVSGDVGTGEIVREHYIESSASGLVSITGGKWTTFRTMALDALTAAASLDGEELKQLPPIAALYGAENYHENLVDELTRESSLGSEKAEWLVSYFGGEASRVAGHLDEVKSLLGEASEEEVLYAACALYSARYEFALTLEDVLSRRLRLAFVDEALAQRVAPAAATVLAREFGWSEGQTERELRGFLS